MGTKYNPAIHKRRSIRLKGYDYAQAGLYFITMCVQNREMLFGRIENGEMILNDAGKMIQSEWEKLPQMFQNIELHEFTVMPNHFHALLEITANAVRATLVVAPTTAPTLNDNDGSIRATTRVAPTTVPTSNDNDGSIRATTRVAPTSTEKSTDTDEPNNKTVGNMMGAFKSKTTVEYISNVKNQDWPAFNGKLWQRNYYEHIIRDEKAFNNISNYIINNPTRWQEDKFYDK